MATHLIIDGYNLLGAMRGLSDRLESAREHLVRDLSAYRHRKPYAITVVFDGWRQDRPMEQYEQRAGVQVVYSKRGEKADQVIQRLVREYGADCAVVSSDHEIMATAKAHGAMTLTAALFMSKLAGSSSSLETVRGKELDPGEDVAPRRGPEKKGNPRKLPKAQRQRNRQLKRF